MRCAVLLALLLSGCAVLPANDARPVRIKKVLVHLLDHDGKHFLSPSLYERDAYQAHLRATRAEQGGLRFDVLWKTDAPRTVTLQAEMRGTSNQKPTEARLSKLIVPRQAGSHWAAVSIEGEDYQRFGQVSAWRVTIWDGDSLLAEQSSFLW